MRGGKQLKGVIPGGSSSPVLRADEIDIAYDFDSVGKAGSMMGSCRQSWSLMKTQTWSSCCTASPVFTITNPVVSALPAAWGTHWARQLLRDFLQNNGSERKLNRLQRVGRNMGGTTLCALGDAASMPIVSFLKKFPDDFRQYYATAS